MIETGRRVARGPDITVPARRIQHVVTEYECKLSRAPGKGPPGSAHPKRAHQTRLYSCFAHVLPTCHMPRRVMSCKSPSSHS